MLQMIQYSNGERRVIDIETMTASEFLTDSESGGSPLGDYELDHDLDGRDIDPNSTSFAVIRDAGEELARGKAILRAIEQGIADGGDIEDWDAPQFEMARKLTGDAGCEWDFANWSDTAATIQNHRKLGGVNL